MSPFGAELAVGLCPDRLVLRDLVQPHDGDVVRALRAMESRRALKVILSSHFVRYAVLPWSADLRAERDWLAYAQLAFRSAYGDVAASWSIRVCPTGHRKPRVATAVDAGLIQALRADRRVASIQPYLMSAFNACRRALRGATAWFVIQEPGRFTVSLVANGVWKLARTRRAHSDSRECLADVLDREHAALGEFVCDRVALYGEEELPASLGRYRLEDHTPARSMPPERRRHAMVLQ